MGAERKYTDRDVREDENLTDAAIDYLERYQGEFDFLVDCKMRIANGSGLNVGMIRGVLNCMRHDPRVKNLPEPLPVEEGQVVPMKGRAQIIRRGSPRCKVPEFHDAHRVPKESNGGVYQWEGHCPGIFEINRDHVIEAKAHVTVPYIAAQSESSYLHRTGQSRWNAKTHWFPNVHRWGFQELDPDLYVRPACTFPRIIRNPFLLDDVEMFELQNSDEPRNYCPRCFPDAQED